MILHELLTESERRILVAKSLRMSTQLRYAADEIKQYCPKYLGWINESKTVPYRGMESMWNSPIGVYQETARTDRQPKDSDADATRLFNQALTMAGILVNRSNSIFVIGDKESAEYYGEVYVIVPMDDFATFAWSKEKRDLVLDSDEMHKFVVAPPHSWQDQFELTQDLIEVNNEIARLNDYKTEVNMSQTDRYVRRNAFSNLFYALKELSEHGVMLPKTFDSAVRLAQKIAEHLHFAKTPNKFNHIPSIDVQKFQQEYEMSTQDFAKALKSGHEIMIKGKFYAIAGNSWDKMKLDGLL